MRLSEYARSRDNNFTLLRLLAAFAVVLAHSWSVLGVNGRDFAYDYVGREIAEMALDMLFVTSGFLVTASLFNRGDLTHFLWARALRLFPAMWLMVPVTVFVLAPALTTLPVKDYLDVAHDMGIRAQDSDRRWRRALVAAGRVRYAAAQG